MIKRFNFTPILGWSASRYGLFEMCKRRYYYTYYAKYDPDYGRKKIDDLKNMTSIPLEIGNIVHDINKTLFERLQKTEEPINKKRFFDYTRRTTYKYCESKTFKEIYYGKIEKLDIDNDVFEKSKVSLENFLNSERFDWLVTKAVKNKRGWIIEPSGFGETRINGMKAYCKVDILFPFENQIVIIDWKTGKPSESKHSKQLLGYASWASFHFDQYPTKIKPVIAYLYPEYNEIEISVNEFDIQEFANRIKSETYEMYQFCVNIQENIPKPKDEFFKTPYKALCNYCNFRELCP